MKTVITPFLLLIVLSGSSMANPQPQVDNSSVYKIIAIAQTELSSTGNTCTDATGIIRFHKNGIYGSAKDSFGRSFNIMGKAEAGEGITGGFAFSTSSFVDFKGQLDSDKKYANGTWEDLSKCKGTWEATKISKQGKFT